MDGGLEDWPLIAAVGLELEQGWLKAEEGRHHQNATIAILDIGRVDERIEQKALCIDYDVALLALDLLARVIAMRIDPSPPFSALLTLWLSIIAAVGLVCRSASSRHFT